MQGINVFIGEKDLKDDGNQAVGDVNGEEVWVRARPIGYQSLSLGHRIKCAWLVFRKKADIVIWKTQ